MLMKNKHIRVNVRSLRQWMEEERLDAFIVPSMDPHNSEYLADHWKTRQWITGFTGSAGTAVITAKGAALWTDSRYFLQAEEQLEGTPFELMREGVPQTPSIADWLDQQLTDERRVGYYGELMTQELLDDIFGGHEQDFILKATEGDPFRYIWHDRPGMPAGTVTIVPDDIAGMPAEAKLRKIFEMGREACPEATIFVLNDLSEIAWALNLRGCDIQYNPVFVGYLMVSRQRSTLFTDLDRLSPEIRAYLGRISVSVKRYKGWKNFIEDAAHGEVFAFPRTMNLCMVKQCRTYRMNYRFIDWQVPLLRAVKTPAEQAGFRRAMELDGVAMVRFLRRLEIALAAGESITETGVDELLTALRAEEPEFKGLSFATIAGYGPHGAIVHYEATPESAALLRPEGLLLLDSGAHYSCGTTDITRTIALGPVSQEERRAYTLVLKGHIALSRCRFPQGTTGIQLDLAARYAMWQAGYDYGHGTGHGVGCRLCVHEGPQQIRKNLRACTAVPFLPGMTITDEPGIYVAGHFGVRIENTLLTVEDGETDYGRFYRFEPLTLCPIDTAPVDLTMLSAEEIKWLNDYHATVRRRLEPLLADPADKAWLHKATMPL